MEVLAERFNAAAGRLVEAVARQARTHGENVHSLAEENVDFTLLRIAHSLKGGADVSDMLKQLEQTTIVHGQHVPEADIILSEIGGIADDYLKAIRN